MTDTLEDSISVPSVDGTLTPETVLTLGQAIEQLNHSVTNTMLYFSALDVNNLPLLLKSFKLLKENKEDLEELTKLISSTYQKLSYEVIPNVFEAMDIDSLKTSGRNFILATRVNASIPEDQREAGHNWLKNVGNCPELIKPTVNAKQLSSFVTSYFEDHGEWPPEDTIKVHKQNYIQVRKT